MINILKKFNKLLDAKQKKKVTLLFVIMLISTVLEVLGVSVMVPIITIIMDSSVMETNVYIKTICNTLSLNTHKEFMIASIVALVILYIVKNSFVIFQHYAQARFVCNNRLAMQRKLLKIMIQRPYEYYLNAKTGEITQMVISDAASAYGLLSTLLSMVTEMIVSAALVVTVFIIEPMMTLLVLVIMLISMTIITRVARPKIKAAGKTFRRCNAQVNSWLIQIVNGIKEIKVTRQEKFFEKEYMKIANQGIKAEKQFKTINGIPKALIEMISVSGALISILILILNGKELTELVPALSAFAVAAIKLLPSVNKITTAINDISYSQSYMDKLLSNIEIMEKEKKQLAEKAANASDVKLTLSDKILFDNVTYSYPNSDRNVIEGASFEIPVGKSVGIVGPSGSGKTTAVDIILGLLEIQAGTIRTDGVDIRENLQDWLSHIGYIPQTIFMLDGTVRDNVAFGIRRDDVDDEKVWKALEEAQLADHIRSLPDGLDSTVGERGIRISGGQRQRIGIARALYYNPELLVFDEATSALDNDTESAIMESINMLHGKKTMIIIAHRLQTIEGCDMVFRVKDGKIQRER